MKEIRNGISMKVSHQINLFFEYMMANRLITKLQTDLTKIEKMSGLSWKIRRDKDSKALQKWLDRKKEIEIEWNSKCDYSIEEFPFIKKDEIINYYNHPSRKNDRNPFMDYYKD